MRHVTVPLATLLVPALLVGIVAIIPACMKETTPSAVEALQVKAAIDSLWAGYAHASDRKDAAAFGALFAEDAALVFPNAPTVRGRDAIGAFLVSLYKDVDPTGMRIEADETKVSGTIAVQSGTFEDRYLSKSVSKTEYGRFVLVAEQGKDRGWKIRRLAAMTDSTR